MNRYEPCPGNRLSHPDRLIAVQVYRGDAADFMRCPACRTCVFFGAGVWAPELSWTFDDARRHGMEPF